MLKKLGALDPMIDIHTKLYIQRFNWLALSYSSSGRMGVQFGLRLYKMVYVGYNFENALGKITSYNYGSHEVNLGINMGLRAVEGIRNTVY